MNKLHVGFSNNVELPIGGFIYIADDVPKVSRARVFDPLKHSFNPLKGITYLKAREIADILYQVSPQGENTLTVRNGKRALLKMLLDGPERLDKLPRDYGKTEVGPLEAIATVDELMMSPVLKRCCATQRTSPSIPIRRSSRGSIGRSWETLTPWSWAYSLWRTSKANL
jgi:hypothetical protein